MCHEIDHISLQVASIPYFTWADLETTTEQEAYLRKFLQEHDVVIPAGRQADNSANADSKSTAWQYRRADCI